MWRMMDGDRFIGWAAGDKCYHVLVKTMEFGIRSGCGVKPGSLIAPAKTRDGPGCVKCMKWARENGFNT